MLRIQYEHIQSGCSRAATIAEYDRVAAARRGEAKPIRDRCAGQVTGLLQRIREQNNRRTQGWQAHTA
jgi:hypothetical protein